ncbi:MAG: heavy-metal-associated domain-containing protein [Nitrosomonas sp.]|nr:heavy-metal-associated domain-containing protein [Nitrosomonas sp.]MBK7364544.1 heavy-metal-associated domain-containing protein [Nitrosomonas sp.]
MESKTVYIKGMNCMGCVSSIKNVLEKLPGVESAEVSLEDACVTIQYDAVSISVDQLKKAIDNAGFEAII